MKYKKVTLGGTFDRFHKGHSTIIDKAFEIGEQVWLGITTDKYFQTIDPKIAKLPSTIQSYSDRETAVKDYLREGNWLIRATIFSIDDKFGTTLTDENLEAIVVSPETELTATEINLLRAQKNWSGLEIVRVEWVLAEDREPINSIRIRRGEIDREGKLYHLPKNWGVRKLPEGLRQTLKQPLGELIEGETEKPEEAVNQFFIKYLEGGRCVAYEVGKRPLIIAVGDAVVVSLIKQGLTPDVSVVDFHIKRQAVYKNIKDLGFKNIKSHKKVKNQAGTITYGAYQAMLGLVRNPAWPGVVEVNGEEDLLTLIAILLAPLETLVVYGQPEEGIVVIEITEEKKDQIMDYFDRFIPHST